jgi:uncharacterized protein (TIGR02569 family)
MRPPPHVLDAFGVTDPTPLPGGRGRSWRAGTLVLKPLDWKPEELRYQSAVLGAVAPRDLRVAAPLPQIVGGWTATPFVEGAHEPGRWLDIIAAGERLHAALAGVPRPDQLLRARDDAWTTGDRVAWGEQPYDAVVDLLDVLEPLDHPSQLVHGDLTGNVLFHPTLPPAVIDFAPYWRPPAFASAVVVADALCWEGAPPSLADAVEPQYLLRALIYRGVTSIEFGAGDVPELRLARRIAGCASP